ncbi:sensor histidine kinase [Glaciimonas immobilis]|uniref:histidine kinase n=1 Tax=Glaciimonas immobilis TaxID=728004 RepID=A0A840RMK5_9BURK|nr:HAMP domain-containing sensor histidine kinase [Glaciimonas immobilis]KAF3998918.1 HAMP domain-containing histidine kinase [Glaciimonas immobilis]MBB5198322.1 signal transduction histidine kinase [Glaciimonas immobilis]
MKLSGFINSHTEQIIKEWESVARTLGAPANQLSTTALRDHVKIILQEIALDIVTVQSVKQQNDKIEGAAGMVADDGSAAATHGVLRQLSGFSLAQLTAEYRALRAIVLRLWLPKIGRVTEETTYDMVRFNEAIDHALAESVTTFSDQETRTRDTFLAILGHDLRSPLATMAMAGDSLSRLGQPKDSVRQIGARVVRSAATMNAMVNDLLEYARTQLGGKMPMMRAAVSIEEICKSALEDAGAAHPDCVFKLATSGNLVDCFDRDRLQQVFSNLLNNAAQYRTVAQPVTVFAEGGSDAIVVTVMNLGPVIPPKSLAAIFTPLVQLTVEGQTHSRPSTSLGLGLFIARQITEAHGGTITVESNETSGTVFTVILPRWKSIQ